MGYFVIDPFNKERKDRSQVIQRISNRYADKLEAAEEDIDGNCSPKLPFEHHCEIWIEKRVTLAIFDIEGEKPFATCLRSLINMLQRWRIRLVLCRSEDKYRIEDKKQQRTHINDVLSWNLLREQFYEDLHCHEGVDGSNGPKKRHNVIKRHFLFPSFQFNIFQWTESSYHQLSKFTHLIVSI